MIIRIARISLRCKKLEETFVDLNDLHNLLGMPTFSGDGSGLLFSCRKLSGYQAPFSRQNCAGRFFNLWTLRVGRALIRGWALAVFILEARYPSGRFPVPPPSQGKVPGNEVGSWANICFPSGYASLV